MVSLNTKFGGGRSLDRGLNQLCQGDLGLCQTVVTARYILTHDVKLLRTVSHPLSGAVVVPEFLRKEFEPPPMLPRSAAPDIN